MRTIPLLFGTASAGLLRVSLNHTALDVSGAPPRYGNPKCPCIGLDRVGGLVQADLGGGKMAPYPADMGARCEEWDLNKRDTCRGPDMPGWCRDAWYYVDPCHCDIAVAPKVSHYLPKSKYQGNTIYFSYSTCGSTDQFTKDNHPTACVNQKDQGTCGGQPKCLWDGKLKACRGKELVEVCEKPLPVNKYGMNNCHCVGIEDKPGHHEMVIDNKMYHYPASTGATCGAWDDEEHPECKGESKKPGWCFQRWCYVDPCKCDANVPPKPSFYMPRTTFQSKPLHFSYSTCGSEDGYTGTHAQERCLQIKDKDECYGKSKCGWNGYKCMDREVAALCSSSIGASSMMAMLIGFLAYVGQQ